MTWEEFQNFRIINSPSNYEHTDIQCPDCKNSYLLRDISVVLTSYPPKYNYVCPNCHWRGTGH